MLFKRKTRTLPGHFHPNEKLDLKVQSFLAQQVKKLVLYQRFNKWAARIVSLTLVLTNAAVLALAIYLCYDLVHTYHTDDKTHKFFAAIGPTLAIGATTVLLFPLSVFFQVYQGDLRVNACANALTKMQEATASYYAKNQKNPTTRKQKAYRNTILKIVQEAKQFRPEQKKTTRILLTALLKDQDG